MQYEPAQSRGPTWIRSLFQRRPSSESSAGCILVAIGCCSLLGCPKQPASDLPPLQYPHGISVHVVRYPNSGPLPPVYDLSRCFTLSPVTPSMAIDVYLYGDGGYDLLRLRVEENESRGGTRDLFVEAVRTDSTSRLYQHPDLSAMNSFGMALGSRNNSTHSVSLDVKIVETGAEFSDCKPDPTFVHARWPSRPHGSPPVP